MEENKVNEIMERIFEDGSLCIIREALTQFEEPQNIKIIVQGGLVEDVKGLRENQTYEIEDLDLLKHN